LESSVVNSVNYVQLLADPLGRYLWVADASNQQILALALDSSTGVVTSQTVEASVANVDQIAADPTGSYLFSRDTSGNIKAFSIGSSGTLTALGTPPATHPFASGPMQVTASGQYLYALDDGLSLGSMYGYAISSAGLTSVPSSPFMINNSGGSDTQFAIDPSSSFVFAVDSASPTQPVDAWTIGASGTLTPLAETLQVPASGNASQISIDPSGQFVYLGYGSAHEVWTYSLAQSGATRGALTAVSRVRVRSSSINAQLLCNGSAGVTFTPQALYVTNSVSNSVSQFSIAPSTGALTSLGAPFTGGSGAAIGTQPEGLAVLPGGSLLYNGDFGSAQVDMFSITSNGALGSSGLQPVVVPGESPASMTTDLSGSFLYIADQLGGNIGMLPIGSGGTLGTTPTTTTSVTGSAPVFVTTDPTGQFIYSANSGTSTVGQYKIILTFGTLSSIAAPINSQGTGPAWVAIDPSGRFLYAPNKTTTNAGTLGEFKIDPSSGALTAGGTQPFITVGTAPSAAVVEPTGKYIFVADSTLNQIFSFTIDSSTGELAANAVAVPAATTGTTPVALGVDISGQYLYCVNSGSNDISIFKINLSNGTLSQVGTATVPTGGTTPFGLAITGTLQ
jgi:6-phosphogluconolactonase (cycloisomerase 2 family)